MLFAMFAMLLAQPAPAQGQSPTIAISADEAESMGGDALADLLIGDEHEPVVDVLVSRDWRDRLGYIVLTERPFVGTEGTCVKRNRFVTFDASQIPSKLHHISDRFAIRQSENCAASDGHWSLLGYGLRPEDGAAILRALSDIQQRIRDQRGPLMLISCTDQRREDACSGDVEETFASLDLSTIQAIEGPRKGYSPHHIATLPVAGGSDLWELRFSFYPDMNDEMVMIRRYPHPATLAPPTPPMPPVVDR